VNRSLESIEKLADSAERLAMAEIFAERNTMIMVIAVFAANRLDR
jgi:nicotinic acid mononucleotide adenylyltransferase